LETCRTLEAILVDAPAAAPSLAAVVVPPASRFCGTMHNKVVYQAAKSLDALGIPVRDSFSRRGLSEGVQRSRPWRKPSLRAALDFLFSGFRVPLAGLCGFNFGSWVVYVSVAKIQRVAR